MIDLKNYKSKKGFCFLFKDTLQRKTWLEIPLESFFMLVSKDYSGGKGYTVKLAYVPVNSKSLEIELL